jgi:hypothetical protein
MMRAAAAAGCSYIDLWAFSQLAALARRQELYSYLFAYYSCSFFFFFGVISARLKLFTINYYLRYRCVCVMILQRAINSSIFTPLASA